MVLELQRDVTAHANIPAQFTAEVDCSGTHPVLVLRGELDLWTKPRFAAALASYAEHYAPIVLDLAELEFIDAGNIGLIHQVRARARLRGTDVILRGPSAQLSRVLELTGLETATVVLPPPARTHERSSALT